MKYIIGIDTGGTYTDAVLMDPEKQKADSIERKSKAITTHEDLSVGIHNSLRELHLSEREIRQVDRVVLSTTLATNAIIENKIANVGCILIGQSPEKRLAAKCVREISGKINIKGRIIQDVSEAEVYKAVGDMSPDIKAIAISGMASTRNPALEQRTRDIIKKQYDIPTTCGCEIVSELGFWERTNTAIINAGLLGIISEFTNAIRKALAKWNIEAPIYLVKGDGNIAKLEAIKNVPIDTALSGCAASMIGSIYLTDSSNAVIADMGGTTTDIGVVNDKQVELSPEGASIGGWNLKVKSAKLFTFGLGGDSSIIFDDEKIKIGPNRVLPACRGGMGNITPTDILHYTGEFTKWDRNKSIREINKQAEEIGISNAEMIEKVKRELIDMIDGNLSRFETDKFPVCAIGAPAKAWYTLAKAVYGYRLIIPKHYEVANAVGAAVALVQEKAVSIIQKGEDGYGYLLYTNEERYSFNNTDGIIAKAVEEARKNAAKKIACQGLPLAQITMRREDVYKLGAQVINVTFSNIADIEKELSGNMTDGREVLEIRIEAYARGRIFAGE